MHKYCCYRNCNQGSFYKADNQFFQRNRHFGRKHNNDCFREENDLYHSNGNNHVASANCQHLYLVCNHHNRQEHLCNANRERWRDLCRIWNLQQHQERFEYFADPVKYWCIVCYDHGNSTDSCQQGNNLRKNKISVFQAAFNLCEQIWSSVCFFDGSLNTLFQSTFIRMTFSLDIFFCLFSSVNKNRLLDRKSVV